MPIEDKQKFFPYHYCPRCKRLSPTMLDVDEDRICKACNRIILDEESGQVVLFDKNEAELRNLPFYGDNHEN